MRKVPGLSGHFSVAEFARTPGIFPCSEAKRTATYFNRALSTIVTRSPASLPILRRVSALIGSMCSPPPIAINELAKGCPSMVPLTFTKPRVPKNSADSGHKTYVHSPLRELFLKRFTAAAKSLKEKGIPVTHRSLAAEANVDCHTTRVWFLRHPDERTFLGIVSDCSARRHFRCCAYRAVVENLKSANQPVPISVIARACGYDLPVILRDMKREPSLRDILTS